MADLRRGRPGARIAELVRIVELPEELLRIVHPVDAELECVTFQALTVIVGFPFDP